MQKTYYKFIAIWIQSLDFHEGGEVPVQVNVVDVEAPMKMLRAAAKKATQVLLRPIKALDGSRYRQTAVAEVLYNLVHDPVSASS